MTTASGANLDDRTSALDGQPGATTGAKIVQSGASGREAPRVSGLPIVGNALELLQDPARFFVRCYRQYGPVYKIRILGKWQTVIAGVEAANFVNNRDGKEYLRSKEFFHGFVSEYGATRIISTEDGESHRQLRDVLKRGYSRESLKGQLSELVAITDRRILADWPVGEAVPVVAAMQSMGTDQLGTLLAGAAPMEYLDDIRTFVRYVLNVLVTRQRPKVFLALPRYRRAKRRVFELAEKMIADHAARPAGRTRRDLVDDVMDAHKRDPKTFPMIDVIPNLLSPYVVGLDTLANTTASVIYAVLKHPEILRRVHAEVDAVFAEGAITEAALEKLPVTQGAIMETMRLYPVAVAQMRTATKDFTFHGHPIREGELLYIATSVPHFLAENFPNPETFDIERYRSPRSEHMKPWVYSPWGRGPHTCLGKSLAEDQMLLTIARMLHRLDLQLDPPAYVLKTRTAPAPGPVPSFRVRVKGLRHPAARA